MSAPPAGIGNESHRGASYAWQLSMNTLEGDPPRPAGYHVYVGAKAPWHDITDDLPQYAVDPPE